MKLFKDITILDKFSQIREHHYVTIDGNRISYIGSVCPEGDFEWVYDGRGKLLMPGFVNAHAHSPMTLMRGYGENLTLMDWLTTKIFPIEDVITGEDVYYAMLLAMAESLRFGIVSTTDMYFFAEDMARAAISAGAKVNIGRATVAGPDDLNIDETRFFKEAKALFENYHNANNGRIKVDMSIHAEYTSTPLLVSRMAEYTKEIGANMHVHVSETRSEHEECKQRHEGKTPIQYLDSLGILDNKTTAAHCVWIEEDDIAIMAEKGVTAASCPVSNLKLASGICNVPALLRGGVNVAIGTDGCASNNSLNFIEEIKFFALLNKERRSDPTLVTPTEAINSATFAGALSQGREDSGRLAEGYHADLIAIDIEGPNMTPSFDLKNNLVYAASGSDVVLTMVDGDVLYDHGIFPTIDVEKAKAETRKAAARAAAKVNG